MEASPSDGVAHCEIDVNSIGVPPACQTPAFTASATALRWKWPGQTSLGVLTTAMRGFFMSLSVYPIPLYAARLCVPSTPWK